MQNQQGQPVDFRRLAMNELKIGGDPLKGIAYAILQVAEVVTVASLLFFQEYETQKAQDDGAER